MARITRLNQEYEWKFLRLNQSYRVDLDKYQSLRKKKAVEEMRLKICAKWGISEPYHYKNEELGARVTISSAKVIMDLATTTDLLSTSPFSVFGRIDSELRTHAHPKDVGDRTWAVILVDLDSKAAKSELDRIAGRLDKIHCERKQEKDTKPRTDRTHLDFLLRVYEGRIIRGVKQTALYQELCPAKPGQSQDERRRELRHAASRVNQWNRTAESYVKRAPRNGFNIPG